MQSARTSPVTLSSTTASSDPSSAVTNVSRACDDPDDALDIALYMLDQECSGERAPAVPPPPPCVHELITEWRARMNDTCGRNSVERSSEPRPARRCSSSSPRTGPNGGDRPKPWSYAEDCVLAHAFSAVTPNAQRAHLVQKLPGRSWNDARARFHYICTVRNAPRTRQSKIWCSGMK